MKLEILRFNSSDDFTSGILFDVSNNQRKFLAYTLEDQFQTTKVHGETRIPAGTYKLTLRAEGGFHNRYAKKYSNKPNWHQGMIYVNDVPNYKWILWHVGNKNLDTAGCLLLGKNQKDGFIGASRVAYEEVYPKVRDAILSGEKVTATYRDYDMESIISNKSRDYIPPQKEITEVLAVEIKHLKAEVKALRQAIILKGFKAN